MACTAESEAVAAKPFHTNQSLNAEQDTDDRERIAALVGTWETSKFGRQVLTARSNGTATMDMSFSALPAAIYGRRVTLQLTWTLEGDSLTQKIVGGSPQRSVEKLIRKYGDTCKYRLLSQNPEQLLVVDVNSGGEPICWVASNSEKSR